MAAPEPAPEEDMADDDERARRTTRGTTGAAKRAAVKKAAVPPARKAAAKKAAATAKAPRAQKAVPAKKAVPAAKRTPAAAPAAKRTAAPKKAAPAAKRTAAPKKAAPAAGRGAVLAPRAKKAPSFRPAAEQTVEDDWTPPPPEPVREDPHARIRSLLRAAAQVKPEGLSHDEEVGYKIVLRACRSPLTMIAENAGQDGGIVCEKVLESKGNNGFNALTNEYEDLVKAGVIDPTKVTRTALANAASVATLLLTSDALIAEKPKEGKAAKGHGGDHDMY